MPITWEMARKEEDELFRFGAHTKTHSVLINEIDDTGEQEIASSMHTLRAELERPSTVFCFPTGRYGVDFGIREMDIVKKSGYKAGLSVASGHIDLRSDCSDDHRFRLRRFLFPDNINDVIQLCSRLE